MLAIISTEYQFAKVFANSYHNKRQEHLICVVFTCLSSSVRMSMK